jgi:hypothetical protein
MNINISDKDCNNEEKKKNESKSNVRIYNKRYRTKSRHRVKYKGLVCLAVISASIVILYLPHAVLMPVRVIKYEMISYTIQHIAIWTPYINSTLNPCFLIIFHDKFRNEFIKMFARFKKKIL